MEIIGSHASSITRSHAGSITLQPRVLQRETKKTDEITDETDKKGGIALYATPPSVDLL